MMMRVNADKYSSTLGMFITKIWKNNKNTYLNTTMNTNQHMQLVFMTTISL